MKVFITGNMGYVGSVLTQYLKKIYPKIQLIGYDTSFFGHSLTGADFIPEQAMSVQHFGDIRDIQQSLLTEVDAVIHLAGISVRGRTYRDNEIKEDQLFEHIIHWVD